MFKNNILNIIFIMEIPGIKKYSNDNIFLNTLNDLTRDAYKNDTKANILDKQPVNRFETDIVLNSKESFDNNNKRINEMQDEIISLKNKLKMIYEKDEEIQKLKNENEKINNELEIKNKKIMESEKLIYDNKNLRDQHDKLQIELMNYNSIKQENELLKKKKNDLEEVTEDEINSEKSININENNNLSKEKIKIDASKLKEILNTRLKTYHEKHIDNLLLENDLYEKEYIDKELLEKILLDAIHL